MDMAAEDAYARLEAKVQSPASSVYSSDPATPVPPDAALPPDRRCPVCLNDRKSRVVLCGACDKFFSSHKEETMRKKKCVGPLFDGVEDNCPPEHLRKGTHYMRTVDQRHKSPYCSKCRYAKCYHHKAKNPPGVSCRPPAPTSSAAAAAAASSSSSQAMAAPVGGPAAWPLQLVDPLDFADPVRMSVEVHRRPRQGGPAAHIKTALANTLRVNDSTHDGYVPVNGEEMYIFGFRSRSPPGRVDTLLDTKFNLRYGVEFRHDDSSIQIRNLGAKLLPIFVGKDPSARGPVFKIDTSQWTTLFQYHAFQAEYQRYAAEALALNQKLRCQQLTQEEWQRTMSLNAQLDLLPCVFVSLGKGWGSRGNPTKGRFEVFDCVLYCKVTCEKSRILCEQLRQLLPHPALPVDSGSSVWSNDAVDTTPDIAMAAVATMVP